MLLSRPITLIIKPTYTNQTPKPMPYICMKCQSATWNEDDSGNYLRSCDHDWTWINEDEITDMNIDVTYDKEENEDTEIL